MAIIMRSNGQKRDQGDKRKQIYTWVGCGLVAVLTLISVIPNSGSEQQAPDYSKFSSSRMQDLAALPFGTDAEAGSFLRENAEYAGIASNADLLGSLFSSEERKERQAQDKAEGVPPPPDPEYKEIARQKAKAEEAEAIKEARAERKKKEQEMYKKAQESLKNKTGNKKTQSGQQVRQQNSATTPGTLNPSSGGGRTSSGGSAVGTSWNYEKKDIKTGNNTTPTAHQATAQDLAFAKGRNADLYRASVESLKGAKADSAEAAATGALEAFQEGEKTIQDIEQDQQELGLDELPKGLNEDLQDELKRTIGDDVNKQSNSKSSDTSKGKEYSVNENCMDSNGHINKECRKAKIYDMLLTAGVEIGKAFFTALIAKI